MATEVVMPKLGMSMVEGTVSNWIIKVGDTVSKGDAIASINSEKIEMDIESPEAGLILDITVDEDHGVPPGTVICYIGEPEEKLEIQKKSVSKETEKNMEVPVISGENTVTDTESRENQNRTIKISPVARKLANAAGVDLNHLQGTGPQGRIIKEDVEKAISSQASNNRDPSAASTDGSNHTELTEGVPMIGIRKVIAKRMQDSLLNSAQLTLNIKIDVTDLLSLQKEGKEIVQDTYGTQLSITDFIARGVILALQKHKQMNSAYIDDQLHQYNHVHLGIAVALENGLVVPVIRHAGNLSLVEISKQIKTLAGDARTGILSSDNMKGSTFTITNLGAFGINHFTPILNSPETGILGVGATEDTPVYRGEELQKRSIMPLSLTFNHQVIDGAPAAAFLQTLKKYLENPLLLLI